MREKCKEASLEDGVPMIEVEDGAWGWGQQGQQEARGWVWLSSQPLHHCCTAQILQCTWGCSATHHSQQLCAQHTSLAPQLLPGHSCGTHGEESFWCQICCSNLSCMLKLSFMYTMLLLHLAINSPNMDTVWIFFLETLHWAGNKNLLYSWEGWPTVAGNTAGRNIIWSLLFTLSDC